MLKINLRQLISSKIGKLTKVNLKGNFQPNTQRLSENVANYSGISMILRDTDCLNIQTTGQVCVSSYCDRCQKIIKHKYPIIHHKTFSIEQILRLKNGLYDISDDIRDELIACLPIKMTCNDDCS